MKKGWFLEVVEGNIASVLTASSLKINIMLAIFQFCGELITKVVVYWQGISIGGFRPFWYLIGIMLLTLFGAFIRSLLFSGVGGSSASSIGGKVSVRTSKKENKKK